MSKKIWNPVNKETLFMQEPWHISTFITTTEDRTGKEGLGWKWSNQPCYCKKNNKIVFRLEPVWIQWAPKLKQNTERSVSTPPPTRFFWMDPLSLQRSDGKHVAALNSAGILREMRELHTCWQNPLLKWGNYSLLGKETGNPLCLISSFIKGKWKK